MGGPQGRSGRTWKNLAPPGFDPRTVQPVANRCHIMHHKLYYLRCRGRFCSRNARKVSGSNMERNTNLLSFYGLRQFRQLNTWILLWVGHDRFLPHLVQCITSTFILPCALHSTVSDTDDVIKQSIRNFFYLFTTLLNSWNSFTTIQCTEAGGIWRLKFHTVHRVWRHVNIKYPYPEPM